MEYSQRHDTRQWSLGHTFPLSSPQLEPHRQSPLTNKMKLLGPSVPPLFYPATQHSAGSWVERALWSFQKIASSQGSPQDCFTELEGPILKGVLLQDAGSSVIRTLRRS